MRAAAAALTIEPVAAWALLAALGSVGAVAFLRRDLRRTFYARHRRWREAPGAFLEVVVVGLLTGAGAGMVLASACLLLATLFARL